RSSARASTMPSPVSGFTPVEGDAATTSWPRWRRLLTTFAPIRPLPPMTTIFILLFVSVGCSEDLVFRCVTYMKPAPPRDFLLLLGGFLPVMMNACAVHLICSLM